MKRLLYVYVLFIAVSAGFALVWQSLLFKKFISNASYKYSTISGGEIGGYFFQRIGTELEIIKCGVYGKSPSPEVVTRVNIASFSLNTKSGFLETTIDGYEARAVFGDLHLFIQRLESEKVPPFMGDLEYGKYRNDPAFQYSSEKKTWYYRSLDAPRLSDAVAEFASSSFLQEKSRGGVVLYNGEFIEEWMLDTSVGEKINPFWNPWVEGAFNDGTGEWFEVRLKVPQMVCYVLNGFVDLYRPHLYKMNCRIKEAQVIAVTIADNVITQDIIFPDFIHFKTILFNEPVRTIRIIIKSTYQGEKWQDCAISAIMFPSRSEWRK
jgi:hypothetical protein